MTITQTIEEDLTDDEDEHSEPPWYPKSWHRSADTQEDCGSAGFAPTATLAFFDDVAAR